MVDKDQINENAGGPTPLDDAWWMSILDSVEEHFNSLSKQDKKPVANKKAQPSSSKSLPTDNEAESIEQDWERTKELYQQDQAIDLKVTGYNRGGILVEVDNLKGFVPISHLVQISRKCDNVESFKEDLEKYVGKTVRLKVIECEPGRGRVIFSERAAQSDSGRRIELLDDLKEGDCLHGYVTTITEFGAFVDLGGMEGLVHISELSWGRVQHPEDIVSSGQLVQVAVLEIDRERSRIALSMKRLLPNPWDTIESKYQPGQIADATITSVVSFGAFARLDPGVDGLIHASELRTNGQRNIHPDEMLSKGQRVQVCILNIDAERQRLGLSLAQIYD
jgi:small subunit ribosomal protein S1